MRSYDMNGKQISMEESIRLWEIDSLRRVDKTILENGYRVSTVLLVLDHRIIGGGPPLIFESMVSLNNSEWTDIQRYSTLAEAKEGHVELVEKYSKTV